ncbi:MAG: hypothetical protein Q9181_005004 [Wetmoreana brouardii]
MSTPRLTFLYPQLYRPRRLHEPAAVYCSVRDSSPLPRRASLSTAAWRKQETYAQRYGPAAESQLPPPSQPPVPNDLGREKSLAGAFEKEVKAPAPKQGEKKAEQAPSKQPSKSKEEPKDSRASSANANPPIGEQAKTLDASETRPKETTTASPSPPAKPLSTVLNRPTPTLSTSSEQEHNNKPPHLQAPPYVHHFDTFSLVRSLRAGGFTQDQSVTLMKAVRGLLTANLEVARDGLVSKSDVENETYLFRAASSELRTEISNTRRTSHQRTSTQLSHLTHEVEILSQRLTQESSALKDELRGMLNDRKMAVRMEEQAMEQAIQELNYRITSFLVGGGKSEVEGLRWVLTRRAAFGIAGIAFVILAFLRYNSYQAHLRDQEQKAAAAAAAENAKNNNNNNPSSSSGGGNFTVPSREMSTQTGADTEAMLANVSRDGNPAYVSLG